MITKLLFTLTVVVGVILFFRTKRAAAQKQQHQPKKILTENEKMFQQGAYLFMLFMVLSAIAVFFFEIGDQYTKVHVHVINTQTGHKMTYEAEQKDIKSSRFKTLDGKTVYVADIERVEIEPVE